MAKRMGAMILLMAGLVQVFGPVATEARDRPVRFSGRVQWIAAQAMAVQLDTGLSVSVDIVRVPQDEYAGLARGERIVVTGIVTDSSRRVIATSIARADEIEAP